jgi:hypothetical protein
MKPLLLAALFLSSTVRADPLEVDHPAVSLEGPLYLSGLAAGLGAAAVGFSLQAGPPKLGEQAFVFTGNRNRDAGMVLGIASVALFTFGVSWLMYRLGVQTSVQRQPTIHMSVAGF